jgi:hypothetical protein
MVDAGLIVFCAFISPFRAEWQPLTAHAAAKQRIPDSTICTAGQGAETSIPRGGEPETYSIQAPDRMRPTGTSLPADNRAVPRQQKRTALAACR